MGHAGVVPTPDSVGAGTWRDGHDCVGAVVLGNAKCKILQLKENHIFLSCKTSMLHENPRAFKRSLQTNNFFLCLCFFAYLDPDPAV